MRKLLLGLLLLAVLFCGCLGNAVYLNMEFASIKADIQKSLLLDEEDGINLLTRSYDRYRSNKKYFDIILRESKSDSIDQLFTEAIGSPSETIVRKKLINIINSVAESEKLCIGSVF